MFEGNYDEIEIQSDSILEASSKCELKDFNSRISISLDRGDRIQIHPNLSEDSIVEASKSDRDKNLHFDITNIRRLVAMGKLRFRNP